MSSVNIIKEKSISIVNSCVDIASKYDFSKIKTVTINTGLTPDEDQYKAMVSLLSGKELILNGEKGTLSLGAGDGSLTASKLTVKGKMAISTTDGMKNDVMLTVTDVEVATGAELTIYDAWILVNQNVREGSSTGLKIDGTVKYDTQRPGAIVAINNADKEGAYLKMTTSNTWGK